VANRRTGRTGRLTALGIAALEPLANLLKKTRQGNPEVHVLDASHFALGTAPDEIAALVQPLSVLRLPIASFEHMSVSLSLPKRW
jgi:hypothetical protein